MPEPARFPLVVAADRARRYWLDALALAFTNDAVSVQRERLSLLTPAEMSTHLAEQKLLEPAPHCFGVPSAHVRDCLPGPGLSWPG